MADDRRDAPDERYVGTAMPHESADAHVTGGALYTDDLAARFPRLLTAWPVCAPHAHAHLVRLDVAPALAVPGVVHVLTVADVRGENDTAPSRRDEPLFPRPAKEGEPAEVLFHSMPVAWVLAEDDEVAKQGVARVVAEYAPLPAVLTIEDAIRARSFHHEGLAIHRGDADRELAASPLRLAGELYVGGQEHFYLETMASIAHVDEAGSLFVHSSTQHPTETQEIVARVVGLAKNDVVVQQLRMGGAFGGKETQANPYAAIAALGALATKRPVRVRLDRLRDVLLTGKRHPFLGRFEVGYEQDGRLRAVKLHLVSDGGFSLDLSMPVLGRALFHADNAYYLPHASIVGDIAKTHKASNTAFRGFGGPQGMLMIEEILDRIARTLGVPPHVVRERNLYREGQTTHYEQPVKDASRLARLFAEVKEDAGFDARLAAVAAFNAASPHDKRGVAITPVKFGISFTAQYYNQAGALVLVYKDGSVQVNHGGTEMGQGLYTKMRQIAADALGVTLERVRVMPTRTDKVPNTSATAASSGSDLNGAAVKAACDEIRSRLLTLALRSLASSPTDEVVFQRDRVFLRSDPARGIGFRELVDVAYHERVQLWASGFYKTPGIHYDAKAGRGNPFYYFAYGAAVSEVQVSGFTGMVELRRVDIVHDVGDSLSPLVDLGQVEGGFAQGVGWLTQEELVWDTAGALRTGNASTYKLPSLGECPPVFRARLLQRAAEPGVVHGSKAVGEPPLMLAFSVREAIRAAVAAFAPDDRHQPVLLACPSTSEAVYWAIQSVR